MTDYTKFISSDNNIFEALISGDLINSDLPIILGDVNGSGDVTDEDKNALEHILNQKPPAIPWVQFLSADVNIDNDLTDDDVNFISDSLSLGALQKKLPPPNQSDILPPSH